MKSKIQLLAILIFSGIVCPLTSLGQDCDPNLDPFCEVPLDSGVILLLVFGLLLWYKIGKLQFKAHSQMNSPCQDI